ncbi:hypothetical protein F8M41_021612 [Gigaspora margarita]|uniref:Uncharacterized protein n=1 Tax=Gigaspora margarita TaxID=4874 RepID=A0A8H4EIR7_GIGMA|nr:hypothetical protein F8M41_021612 [Gigaspora margarita]
MIKILEGKLSLAQKDVISIQKNLSKKEAHSALFRKFENLFLKTKIAELDNIKSKLKSKINELECLKLEAISKPVDPLGHCFAIVGEDNEKNMQSKEQSSITKSDNISAVLQSRPLDNKSVPLI